jgi:DMSO/TMAO reductase YedYZ molybdopterin-dependent catalytic subunit
MRARAALAGLLAAGVALGVGELFAGLFRDAPSPVGTVGEEVIDLSPRLVVRFGIDSFGSNDKPALVVTILVVSLLLGAAAGVAGETRRWVPPAAFAAFAVVGTWAAADQPLASTGWALVTNVVAAIAGTAAWEWLRPRPEVVAAAEVPDDDPMTAFPFGLPGSRRQFLVRAGVAGTIAAVTPALGRRLNARFDVEEAREAIDLVAATSPTAAADGGLAVPGLSPLYTPNDDFYRIDTALVVPQVRPDGWTLKVTGAVDQELEMTLDDLLAEAREEADVTISCVSNEVGGDLIGNARWLGIPLRDLLDRAGPTDGAEQVVGVSVDGFTAGFPIELAYDGRPALVAVGMNGEALPVRHGFPARLIVSGVYGYVSATKWLSHIHLTGWDDLDGYWIPRGWAKLGPIKLQSRIDVPRRNARVEAGTVPVAGVAWAQPDGIERVEVSVDDGEWAEAELGEELSVHTWRQWLYRWDATPGQHRLSVRAVDKTGEIQTADTAPVAPDGATGHHTISVQVT